MKSLLVVFGAVLLVQLCAADDQCIDIPADMNTGAQQGSITYEDFLYHTVNSTDPACHQFGCCPRIVKYPASKASVIEPFTGYRGNAAIIVDYGGDSNPCNPYRRRCTNDDSPFVWYVSWGDGTHDWGIQKTIGPWQKTHQYAKYCKQYGVRVFYCSYTGCPHRRCCDTYYRVIDVSFDPQQPNPEIEFEQF